MKNTLAVEQEVQELEYNIPYHYIPKTDNDAFSQTIHWSWGMRYLGGIELVLAELAHVKFTSLLDVGCGDGRFLREVQSRFHGNRIKGVDYSSNAIALANALNPNIDYSCLDITSDTINESYDVITMIEVLEHIPLDGVDRFLKSVSDTLGGGGQLILTVPHSNKRVSAKHFQHFSSKSLREALSPYFEIDKISPFDKSSRLTNLLIKLLGGQGKNYIITNNFLNRFVFKRILKYCMAPLPESKCCRLLAVARRK